MPTAGDHMQPLKEPIDHKLMPTLVKYELNDMELELMRLPALLGGMSFDDPVVDTGRKHADSIECTANLNEQILENGTGLMQRFELDSKKKATVWQRHEASLKVKADDLQRRIPEPQKHTMAQVREGLGLGASPIHLHYCWLLDNLPSICPCEERFTVDHAQICNLSGFIHMRHNDPTNEGMDEGNTQRCRGRAEVAISDRRIPPALNHQH